MDDQKLRNLRNVVVFALGDGELDPKEQRFIDTLRQRLGISSEQFKGLLADIRSGERKLQLPRGSRAVETIEQLAQVAVTDGNVSPAEMDLLRRIGDSLGVPAGRVDQLIARAAPEDDADQADIEAAVREIYANFAQWDQETREKKIAALGQMGRSAALALLRMLESYRKPDGMDDALELKTSIVRELGRLEDDRAAYYLAQQVTIGDSNDETTNAALRTAAAEALGKVTGRSFSPDAEGIAAARRWWDDAGNAQYGRLIM